MELQIKFIDGQYTMRVLTSSCSERFSSPSLSDVLREASSVLLREKVRYEKPLGGHGASRHAPGY